MLPPQHSIPELEEIRPAVEAFLADMTGAEVHRDDLLLIGQYLHTYTNMELSMHRAVRMFRQLGTLSARETRRPAASDLPGLVMKGSAALNLSPQQHEELKEHMDQIVLRQPFRNLLAHWHLFRLPDTDIVVFITMDERDGQALGHQEPTHDGLYYGIARGADLRGLALHIRPYGQWLAEKAAEWHRQLFPGT